MRSPVATIGMAPREDTSCASSAPMVTVLEGDVSNTFRDCVVELQLSVVRQGSCGGVLPYFRLRGRCAGDYSLCLPTLAVQKLLAPQECSNLSHFVLVLQFLRQRNLPSDEPRLLMLLLFLLLLLHKMPLCLR